MTNPWKTLRVAHFNGIAHSFQRSQILLLLLGLSGVVAMVACRPSLTYANRHLCSSLLSESSSGGSGYSVPVSARDGGFQFLWDDMRGTFVLLDARKVPDTHPLAEPQSHVHFVPFGQVDPSIETSGPIYDRAHLFITDKLIGFVTSANTASISGAEVHVLNEALDFQGNAFLAGTSTLVWHPEFPTMAGKFYEPEYGPATDLIRVFEYNGLRFQSIRILSVEDTISTLFGWSLDGQWIATSVYRREGVTLIYANTIDDRLLESQLPRVGFGCIRAAAWSPTGNQIAVVSTAGEIGRLQYDVFLEEIDEGVVGEASNLTKTQDVDEYMPSWSPDGRRIAFVEVSAADNGAIRQEIAVIDLDVGSRITRLTDSETVYETEPVWVSDTEIAFLRWIPDGESWWIITASYPSGEVMFTWELGRDMYEIIGEPDPIFIP